MAIIGKKSRSFKGVSPLSNKFKARQKKKKKVRQKETLKIIHPLELDVPIMIADKI